MERSCSQQQFVMEMPMEELVEISEAMRDGLQGRIKDRTHRLRTYRRCFPGAAGVRWLVESGHAAGDEQAVALGNAMLQAGLLRHVAYEHTFKNTQLLYKFTSDDEGGPLRELSASRPASCRQSETGTPRLEGTPPDGLASAASMPGSLHSRLPRFTPPAPGGGSSFAHRALLNAQVHSLNQKLERLASQHATLLAANAQQQEVWEGQASSDLREVKEAIGQLAGALAATQEQVLQLVSQASSTHGLLSSQRAVSAVQQLIMALAMLALGTGWAPPALWALAAAAAGALAVVLMDWGADDARERRAAAQEQLAAQRLSARGLAARLSGGGGGGGLLPLITSLQGERLGQRNGVGGAKLGAGGDVVGGAAPGGVCVVASTSTGSTASEGGSDAPPPMAREAEALLVGRVMGGKLLEDTAPALEEFEGWPDGDVILRPTPKSSDLAVTRVTRYASPSHVAVPTELHARWEADQAPYTGAADGDADEQQQQARRDSGGGGGESGGWVPQPGAGLPLNQYVIHFESDLFVGKMLSYIKGLPSSHEPYFTGKKRRSGRFKRPLGLADVVTGQEFDRPFKNLRGCWLMEKVILAFAKRVVTCLELGDVAKNPYMVFPLMALAHRVNVAHPGQEPPIDQAEEDMRLWDPSLVDRRGAPMAADARRKFFMTEANLEGRTYSTDHVWTFYIWQQVIDVSGYFLDLMVQQYDMIQHLDGQPLQSMIKHKPSGRFLFHMVYWNRKQIRETERISALYAEADAAALAAARAAGKA